MPHCCKSHVGAHIALSKDLNLQTYMEKQDNLLSFPADTFKNCLKKCTLFFFMGPLNEIEIACFLKIFNEGFSSYSNDASN